MKVYVRGDALGNLAFGVHVLLAAIIAFGGARPTHPVDKGAFPALPPLERQGYSS